MTIKVDTSLLEKRVAELAKALHQDGADTMRDEARLFLKAAMKITPPQKRIQGEQAVERDQKRIFGVVSDGFAQHMAQDFGTENIRHWLTLKTDGSKTDFLWERLDVDGSGMDAWYNQHRNAATGHTNRIRFGQKSQGAWVEKYVVSNSAFGAFLKKLKLHVGTQKAGWATSFIALAGKVPAWIKRNIPRSKSEVRNNLNAPGHPQITMINRAAGVKATGNQIRTIVKIRTNALTRRLKLITSGYAKDMKAKLKISKKAFITPGSDSAD